MESSSHPLVSSSLADATLAPDGSDLVLVEWTDAGGGEDPPGYLAPRHIHRADDEAFYVLEGSLAFELDGEMVTVDAGGAVMIRKGTAHTWWNPEPLPCRYLIMMTRRVHELITALHAPDRTRSFARVFQDHESELLEG